MPANTDELSRLNAILGFSEMMRDGLAGPPSSKWQDYAASVNDAGSHLLALIDEILDLSKIEAGRVTLEIEPIELPRLFHACTEIISPMMARAQVTFDTVCAQTVAIIQADPIRLKQIILNLLSNAAKFTLPGGRIELSAMETEDDSVAIQVSDTGIGMTTEQVSKALEVFGQIDSEVARRHQGSGLGLPIAAGLAELHGGRLAVESAPGTGTVVTITLPYKSKNP